MKNNEIAPVVPTKLPFDRNVNSEFPNNNNQSNYHYFTFRYWKGKKNALI